MNESKTIDEIINEFVNHQSDRFRLSLKENVLCGKYDTAKADFLFDPIVGDECYKAIPNFTRGIYIFYDLYTNAILYVGKSKNLRQRFYAYAGRSTTPTDYNKMISWFDNGHTPIVAIFKCDEILNEEQRLIGLYKPLFNIRVE